MKLGWGEINLEGKELMDLPDNFYDFRDRIFTLIPQAEIEMNMTKWFKINVGIGYHIVTSIDATYLNNSGKLQNFYNASDFNSPVGTISLIFGGHHQHSK